MKRQLLKAMSLCAGMVWVSLGVASATSPCPSTLGASTVCSTIITVTDDGSGGFSVSSMNPLGGTPYDGSEDSLVGVVNNSSQTIMSIYLTGTNIFGFELDGMCSAPYASAVTGTNSCSGPTLDPNGYGGNEVNFVVDSNNAGGVNFVNGIAAGGTQYFSLEEDTTLETNAITPQGASETSYSGTPEPGTMTLLGAGLVLLVIGRNRVGDRLAKALRS